MPAPPPMAFPAAPHPSKPSQEPRPGESLGLQHLLAQPTAPAWGHHSCSALLRPSISAVPLAPGLDRVYDSQMVPTNLFLQPLPPLSMTSEPSPAAKTSSHGAGNAQPTRCRTMEGRSRWSDPSIPLQMSPPSPASEPHAVAPAAGAPRPASHAHRSGGDCRCSGDCLASKRRPLGARNVLSEKPGNQDSHDSLRAHRAAARLNCMPAAPRHRQSHEGVFRPRNEEGVKGKAAALAKHSSFHYTGAHKAPVPPQRRMLQGGSPTEAPGSLDPAGGAFRDTMRPKMSSESPWLPSRAHSAACKELPQLSGGAEQPCLRAERHHSGPLHPSAVQETTSPATTFSGLAATSSDGSSCSNVVDDADGDGDSFIFNVTRLRFPKEKDQEQPSSVAVKPKSGQNGGSLQRSKLMSCQLYTQGALERATGCWSPSAILGKGSFGTVFTGEIHGQKVAIKKLDIEGWQGPKEYTMEVEVLGTIRHPNVVRLLGHCPQLHCLVYELVPNGSLQDWLRDETKRASLGWERRTRILHGLASALIALHGSTPAVVHRDLKPENVLLDAHLSAKLADVGLARLLETEDSTSTYTLSGTAGYIDPVGMRTFEISPAADVYAFGLIALQVLLGEPRVSRVHQVLGECQPGMSQRSAAARGTHAKILNYMEGASGHWPQSVALEVATMALQCVHRCRDERPNLQRDVVPALERLMHVLN